MDEKRKLTKRVVDAIKPADKPAYFWDSEISGFGVKVSPSGRKTYVFKYRTGGGRAGRSREPAIGPHGNLTPDQARDIARGWAAQIAAGGDPSGSRTAKRAAPTVSDLLDRYIAEHVRKKNKKSTQTSAVQLVENVIRPALGRLKTEDIKRADVAKFHSGLSGTPYQANRALAALSKALSLAEVWGMRPEQSNPCRRIQRFKEEARERLVLPDEFARLGSALGPIDIQDSQTG